MNDYANQLSALLQRDNQPFHIRTVTDVGVGNVVVDFGSETESIPIPRLKSYAPVVGDQAFLVRSNTGWLAIGAVAENPTEDEA